MTGSRAVFVDRDGVVNELAPDPETGLPEGPLRVDDVELIPGAAEGLIALRAAGYLLVCVSNQPAAAKLKTTIEEIGAVDQAVQSALQAAGAHFDAVQICLHHPDGAHLELGVPCRCRKPEPGMLIDAALGLDIDLESSWMIGDSDSDVEAGKRAGCRTILIDHRPSAHRRAGAHPDARASDLAEAAAVVFQTDLGAPGR